jgi:hypothetical protein
METKVPFLQNDRMSYHFDTAKTSAVYLLVDLLEQRYIFGVLPSSFTQIPRRFPKLDTTARLHIVSNY